MDGCKQDAEVPLKLVQTAAVLEVLHSVLGLVRSPVAITGVPPRAQDGQLV